MKAACKLASIDPPIATVPYGGLIELSADKPGE